MLFKGIKGAFGLMLSVFILLAVTACARGEEPDAGQATTGDRLHVGMNYKEQSFDLVEKSEEDGEYLFIVKNDELGALRVHVPESVFESRSVGDRIGIGQTKQFDVNSDSFGIAYFMDGEPVLIEDPGLSVEEARAYLSSKEDGNAYSAAPRGSSGFHKTMPAVASELENGKTGEATPGRQTGIGFGEALGLMLQGRRVRREGWSSELYIYRDGSVTMLHSSLGDSEYSLEAAAEQGDLVASDWTSVDE